MSSGSQPISPVAFALAIHDLPIGSLHGKAAEIRNSINHLQSSNMQLQTFARDGDADCAEAIRENKLVMQRMEERITILKEEVMRRGLMWPDEEGERETMVNGCAEPSRAVQNMDDNGSERSNVRSNIAPASRSTQPVSGGLTDEELRRRLVERMGDDDEDDGIHL